MRDILLFTAIDFHMPPICSPIVMLGLAGRLEAAPVISLVAGIAYLEGAPQRETRFRVSQ